ncbi:MAG: hypothetical protein IPM64_17290 [Phycisphaerales bacterium]|nr:hypothetical protein [Phycisphaerales bacterium]
MNAFQCPNREAHGREIFQQQIIRLKLSKNRIKHLLGVPAIAADQQHETSPAIQHRPQARNFAKCGLAKTSRHCQRQQLAINDDALHHPDCNAMIAAKRNREQLGEVGQAEPLQVIAAFIPPSRIHHGRRGANVSPAPRQLQIARPGLLFHALVCSESVACTLRASPRRRRGGIAGSCDGRIGCANSASSIGSASNVGNTGSAGRAPCRFAPFGRHCNYPPQRIMAQVARRSANGNGHIAPSSPKTTPKARIASGNSTRTKFCNR